MLYTFNQMQRQEDLYIQYQRRLHSEWIWGLPELHGETVSKKQTTNNQQRKPFKS